MEKRKSLPDAGLRSLDHYQQKLPPWRYSLRKSFLPLVRWETPYLAWLQETVRTPSLDSWFAITANLGTHTFYMVMLPMLFWCGYTDIGRGMVHLLAAGVFFSGVIKDLLCLPRPLSPPLQRITMSGSAALEYGFPSTHSTNAISVVYYAIHLLNSPDTDISPLKKIIFQTLLYLYGTSIVFGRLYCGMHGFLDVIVGSTLGAVLAFIQCSYGSIFDDFLFSSTIQGVIVVALVILTLVRIHPEPADSCPCFDDSVAFAGVLIGHEFGNWHYAQTRFSVSEPIPGTVPFSLERIGWFKSILRILLGVVIIVVWREVMKPSLLRFLPPVFRVIERLGLSLPRRFFTKASEYKRIPDHLKDDDVIPNVSEIPSMLTSIRHPRRRAISIGPQSEADAYETLAYRQKRRRESMSPEYQPTPNGVPSSPLRERPLNSRQLSEADISKLADKAAAKTPARSPRKLDEYENMMGMGSPAAVSNIVRNSVEGADNVAVSDAQLDEQEEKEMFSRIKPPRVRYDVEVVTKLIVYSGIGWLAVEMNPILFYLLGLGS
ncbi:hypothetical protein AJ80_09353 [Polytolypa hystricis UAMH7299]|uniref:Phosphatidic acid phosphatase type 2/haloperoxidase domain-containing protein n=1 Tax=Polytolypa hystricis (strain UAMH7299) TaxID=1447883 RepID=A0A2B7WS75_POLH7|nr:hypothetical protein AJ80_09353 [Polytolypa hystricis UAMH7299]